MQKHPLNSIKKKNLIPNKYLFAILYSILLSISTNNPVHSFISMLFHF